MTTRILFVCLGNICRSPAAQGVMEHLGRTLDLEIDSAGIGGWHAGDPPDPRMQAAMRERGMDISGQHARQVRAEDFLHYDWILCMDRQNLHALDCIRPLATDPQLHRLLDLLPAGDPERGQDVPDPYYGGADGFGHVIDLVVRGCEALRLRLLRDGCAERRSARF